jgi:ketosteroid isomerase-like protein
VEGPFSQESQTMAWVSGIIVLKVAVTKANQLTHSFENTFRASFVLRKEDENKTWKIIHEHVSIAHTDPYGIGDWLK